MSNSTEAAIQVTHLTTWLTNDSVLAIATIVGVALSAFGLFFSILAFMQAKYAKQAASEAKEAVYHIDSLSEITKALSILDDIQAHLRSNNLTIIPEKFLTARALLTTVRHSCPGLTERDQEQILNSCNQISTIKSAIERALQGEKKSIAYAKYNDILTQQTETPQEVLEVIKRRET